MEQGICSVEIGRNLHVTIQGRENKSALPVGMTFESLDDVQFISTFFSFEKHFTPSSFRKKTIKKTSFIQWLNGTCFV